MSENLTYGTPNSNSYQFNKKSLLRKEDIPGIVLGGIIGLASAYGGGFLVNEFVGVSLMDQFQLPVHDVVNTTLDGAAAFVGIIAAYEILKAAIPKIATFASWFIGCFLVINVLQLASKMYLAASAPGLG